MTPPDPVYTVVAEMFDELARDHERLAEQIRVNAAILRAKGPDPDEIVPRSLKVVPEEGIPL